MRAICLALLTALGAGSAAAQSISVDVEPGPHGVSVVKTRWHKRFYNPALEEDPLRPAQDATRLQRERQATQRQNTVRGQLGRERVPLPSQTADSVGRGIVMSDPRIFYIYEVRITNTGAKKIRSITWEYVFSDLSTQREVGRHHFENKVGVEVGKAKTLMGISSTPPAETVDVRDAPKRKGEQYYERVDVRRVEYTDGTFWERERK